MASLSAGLRSHKSKLFGWSNEREQRQNVGVLGYMRGTVLQLEGPRNRRAMLHEPAGYLIV